MSEANRDAIAHRIRALLAKTVENGATEAEALSAMEKAGELMGRYRLSMTDVEIEAEPIADLSVERNLAVRWAPADSCLHAIQRYCGVRCWKQPHRAAGGRTIHRLRILGLKPDAEMAQYLYELITSAIHVAQEVWAKATLTPGRDRAVQNRRDIWTFQLAMAGRLATRLNAMAEAAEASQKTGSGTALVVVKTPIVKQALADLQAREGGWRFASKSVSSPLRGSAEAYAAGRDAGDKVNLSRPVRSAGTKQLH